MTRFVGTVLLSYPLRAFTAADRERIGDLLSSIAADIKKGQSGDDSYRWEVAVELEEVPF